MTATDLAPGGWSFRDRGVLRDPALQHVVGRPGYPPEYVAGPEPCESCGCPVAYFRRRGQIDGAPDMVRVTSSAHTVRVGAENPATPGHVRCGATYVEHTLADCQTMQAETAWGVSFVAPLGGAR